MADKGKGKGPQKDDSAKRNKQQEVEQRQAGPQSQEQAWIAAVGAYQRVSASPPSAILPKDILTLQRTAGNRAVTQLLQAKLNVGPVGDKYEQEADRVAETVLRMPEPASESTLSKHSFMSDWPMLQRFEEEEESALPKLTIQQAAKAPPDGSDDDGDDDDAQNDIQRAGDGDGSFQPGHDFERNLSRASGGGVPLSEVTQNFMEPRFGADFGSVRVHTDSEAGQLNRDIGAQAFTHGADVFFGDGKYVPGTMTGKSLLAHELTHVVQQGGATSANDVQGKADPASGGVVQRLLRGDAENSAYATLKSDGGGVSIKAWFNNSTYNKILNKVKEYEKQEKKTGKGHKSHKWFFAELDTIEQGSNTWLDAHGKEEGSADRAQALRVLIAQVQAERQQLMRSPEALAGSFDQEEDKLFFLKLWEYSPDIREYIRTLVSADSTLKNVDSAAYLIEALDPQHRYGLGNYGYGYVDSDTTEPFLDWLEENTKYDFQLTSKEDNKITYFGDEERKEFRLTINGNNMNKADEQPLTGNNIYALSRDNAFYATDEHSKVHGRLHHTSFMAGQSIRAAGHMHMSGGGKLLKIDNVSGHYGPSESNLVQALAVLQNEGMDLSKVTAAPWGTEEQPGDEYLNANL